MPCFMNAFVWKQLSYQKAKQNIKKSHRIQQNFAAVSKLHIGDKSDHHHLPHTNTKAAIFFKITKQKKIN